MADSRAGVGTSAMMVRATSILTPPRADVTAPSRWRPGRRCACTGPCRGARGSSPTTTSESASSVAASPRPSPARSVRNPKRARPIESSRDAPDAAPPFPPPRPPPPPAAHQVRQAQASGGVPQELGPRGRGRASGDREGQGGSGAHRPPGGGVPHVRLPAEEHPRRAAAPQIERTGAREERLRDRTPPPGEAEGPRRKRRRPSGNSNTRASFAAPLSRLPRVRPSLASPPPRARSAALPISSVTLTAPPPRPTSASRRSW